MLLSETPRFRFKEMLGIQVINTIKFSVEPHSSMLPKLSQNKDYFILVVSKNMNQFLIC